MVVKQENQLAKMPKEHFMLTKGLQWQTDIRINWQKCPNSSQCSEQSSTTITHQNQLAKYSNSTSCPKQFLHQTHFRTKGHECANSIRAHKWSSMVVGIEPIGKKPKQYSVKEPSAHPQISYTVAKEKVNKVIGPLKFLTQRQQK